MREHNHGKKTLLNMIIWILAFFLINGYVLSQTSVTLKGVVIDEEGGRLPGVTLNARNRDSGYVYSAVTLSDGQYLMKGILPGPYTIEVSLQGFATLVRKGLTFNVGAELTLNFTLTPATLKEEVTVVGESPMVEVTKSEISSVVNRKTIDDLPLLDRNFSSLTFLKAGVEAGRTGAQSRGSGEMLIDGVSNEFVGNNTISAGIPADAIQEFRVMTNQFQVEYGNASGLIQNVITRSGTNDWRGRASYFYRDEGIDSVNYFVNHAEYKGDELPKDEWQKPDYKHSRFGGFLGGPIKKDKLHFFITYEGLRHTSYAAVTSPLVPQENVEQSSNNNQFFFKMNYQLNSKNLFSFRYGYDHPVDENVGVGGYNTRSRGQDNIFKVHDLQLNWTFFPSNTTVNELRLYYNYHYMGYLTSDPDSYRINRPSGFFGSLANVPQETDSSKYQVVDNFSIYLGNHSLKVGFDYTNNPVDGYVDYYVPGLYIFTTDKPFNPSDFSTYPYLFIYNSGITDWKWPYTSLGIFVQDSWKIHPRLTLNLGLRYNYSKIKALDIDNSNIRNFNPRFGFSWDPVGDGKTSIRGGVGTYSSNILMNAGLTAGIINEMEINMFVFPNYPDPFKLNPFFPPIQGSQSVGEWVSKENLIAPYSLQTTLGFQREAFSDFLISADLVWVKGFRMLRQEQLNPVIPGTRIVRIDPTKGDVFMMGDLGKSDYKGLYLNFNKRYSHGWSLEISYTLARSWADVEDERGSGPVNYEDPERIREFGPTARDAYHRLVVSGIVDLPWGFQVSGIFFYQSALPWTAFYQTDVNLDGLVTDYVDYRKNSRRGFDYNFINARISKYIRIHRFSFQIFVEVYNFTNRVNFGGIVNRLELPNFGEPTIAGDPRLIQLGARIEF